MVRPTFEDIVCVVWCKVVVCEGEVEMNWAGLDWSVVSESNWFSLVFQLRGFDSLADFTFLWCCKVRCGEVKVEMEIELRARAMRIPFPFLSNEP